MTSAKKICDLNQIRCFLNFWKTFKFTRKGYASSLIYVT